METQNPRKWRYTWESQSHVPILKLFLFNPQINPISHCNDLEFDLQFEKSLFNVSWNDQRHTRVSLAVPLPRVLVDLEYPVRFRVSDDHIEVKIGLLLSVDHPIVSSFVSDLLSDDEIADDCVADCADSRYVDSDVKRLSCEGEVHFYCRSCSFRLTRRPIRNFVELPSVNWTEAADNWFGSCCCSFGGVSERMVNDYVKSYGCVEGTCLLSSTSVIICKDDLVGCQFAGSDAVLREVNVEGKLLEGAGDLGVCHANGNCDFSLHANESRSCSTRCKKEENVFEDHIDEKQLKKESSCALRGEGLTDDVGPGKRCCSVRTSDRSVELLADQKSFLNGYLGNIFIFRSPALSKEVEWVEFACLSCSSLLGAYPCLNGLEPLDGGIRLLKCCISTSLPGGSSRDLFRKYTLENMFANHLMESAKDELSFRTVVKDVKSRSIIMEIVLVNPNSWCCSGYCSEDQFPGWPKINLHPVIKVLFSNWSDDPKANSRNGEERGTKELADEVFMLRHPVSELIKCLELTKDMFPPSFSSSRGLSLSCIRR